MTVFFFFRFFIILLILRSTDDEIWFRTLFIMFKISKKKFLYKFLMFVCSFFSKISIFMNCFRRKFINIIILKLIETTKNAVLTVELNDAIKNNVLILMLNETVNDFRSKNEEREKNDWKKNDDRKKKFCDRMNMFFDVMYFNLARRRLISNDDSNDDDWMFWFQIISNDNDWMFWVKLIRRLNIRKRKISTSRRFEIDWEFNWKFNSKKFNEFNVSIFSVDSEFDFEKFNASTFDEVLS